jgi:nicotinate (nicotinamide) nucleotide adenylyltransferase
MKRPEHHRLPLSSRMRVGILGGSFNPAHDGHLQLSELALRKLRLDRVVWMVSPQNPLKPKQGMERFSDRFASACSVAQDARIIVSDFEYVMSSPYTTRSLTRLCAIHPRVQFVWIMGADNLSTVHRWDRWTEIFAKVPVAVVARPGYQHRAAFSCAATRYKHARLRESEADQLVMCKAPAWIYLRTLLNPISSTQIRHHAAGQGRRWPEMI